MRRSNAFLVQGIVKFRFYKKEEAGEIHNYNGFILIKFHKVEKKRGMRVDLWSVVVVSFRFAYGCHTLV